MKNAVINVKVDEKTKKNAQKLARELGLNLSVVISGFLKTFVVNKKVTFDANPPEEPSDYMLKMIKEAEEENEYSPVFEKSEDAIAWLKDKNRKYENSIQKKVHKNAK